MRFPGRRSAVTVAPLPLVLLATLLHAPAPASAAIIGAELHNVSSDTTQFSYVGRWRSDTEDGVYQAYSNDTDAVVTFSFVGVGASYLAEKRDDRGICQIQVDDESPTYMDLYDNSGFSQGLQAIWSSGTLVYGQHNVTISQVGPDSRFGYYPYLVTSTWLEAVPSDVAAYLSTQVIPSSTASAVPTQASDSSPNVGAIVGGTIGAVLAAMLLGFLFYLYWRDRAQRKRGDGAPVEKVKKADGKMTIEDEPEPSPHGAGAPYPGWGAGYAAYGYPHNPYGAYSSGGAYAPYGYNPSSAGGSAWGGYAPHQQHQGGGAGAGAGGAYLSAPLSAGSLSADSHGGGAASASRGGGTGGGYSVSSAAGRAGADPTSRGSNYDSAYHSGDGSDSRSYPYHVQGFGSESRSYPVPEI